MPDFDECCDPAELLDLSGRKGLVVGIANDRSLAWPAALHFRQAGAELAITYVDERTKPHVVPLAARLEAPILLPCDVNAPHELDAVFDAITLICTSQFSFGFPQPLGVSRCPYLLFKP